ncbi:hypothetical protein B0T22DRAFT_522966 [Podospora appendiculata]|uniref:F-box domain-containing protein n=1 Tax=Podospora appendiculata TaxID=314037 RepID=A0AAE0WZZ3_9PEZI|nr:hypothetical protein B0T22DRAFT_522966 [Podospora appendiculata]
MTSILSLSNELLDHIARSIDTDADLATLSATCRRIWESGNYILYSRAAKRHLYLLAWAAETGRVGTLKRLLAAGVSPNTAVYTTHDRRRKGGEARMRSIRPSRFFTPFGDRPRDRPILSDRDGTPYELFRNHYLVKDSRIIDVELSDEGFKTATGHDQRSPAVLEHAEYKSVSDYVEATAKNGWGQTLSFAVYTDPLAAFDDKIGGWRALQFMFQRCHCTWPSQTDTSRPSRSCWRLARFWTPRFPRTARPFAPAPSTSS